MQATAVATSGSGTTRAAWRRAAPVACGCALAGAAALVARFDPAAQDSHFPACGFRALTGLWCPGCGLTRGFHQLFTGHPMAAMQHNLFVPVVLLAVVWWFASWTRSSWGRTSLPAPRWVVRSTITVLPAALVIYGVLRNIPAAPFFSLAP